jgi:hypothetical protein
MRAEEAEMMWLYRHPEFAAIASMFVFFGVQVLLTIWYWAKTDTRGKIYTEDGWLSPDEVSRRFGPKHTDGRAFRNQNKEWKKLVLKEGQIVSYRVDEEGALLVVTLLTGGK